MLVLPEEFIQTLKNYLVFALKLQLEIKEGFVLNKYTY